MNRVLWYIGRRRPLFFFGVPGIVLLAAGLISGVYVTSIVLQRHVTPIGMVLISVFTSIGGAMTVYAGLILSTIGNLETVVQAQAPTERAEASREAPTSASPTWPLLLFGIPGMLGLMGGLAWGVWAVGAFVAGKGLLPGSFIGSSALCVGSLMTWLTGIVLHALHDILVELGATQEE